MLRWIFRILRITGDINAVKQGRAGRRVSRRVTRRGIRRLFR